MAQYDFLNEHSGKTFSSNAATNLLVRGKEPSLGHMAAHQINAPKAEAWKVLPEAVRTGKTAFMLAHEGETMYQVLQPQDVHLPLRFSNACVLWHDTVQYDLFHQQLVSRFSAVCSSKTVFT